VRLTLTELYENVASVGGMRMFEIRTLQIRDDNYKMSLKSSEICCEDVNGLVLLIQWLAHEKSNEFGFHIRQGIS
jgi:hypothetical protein